MAEGKANMSEQTDAAEESAMLVRWIRFVHGFSGLNETVYNSRSSVPSNNDKSTSVAVWDRKACSASVREQLNVFIQWAVSRFEREKAFANNFLPLCWEAHEGWRGYYPPVRMELLLAQIPMITPHCLLGQHVYIQAGKFCEGSVSRLMDFLHCRLEKKQEQTNPEGSGSTGLSRGKRKRQFQKANLGVGCKAFLDRWYNEPPAKKVFIEASKGGLSGRTWNFSHTDIIRLARVKGRNNASEFVIRYLLSSGRQLWGGKGQTPEGDDSPEEDCPNKFYRDLPVSDNQEIKEIEEMVGVLEKLKHPSPDTDIEEIRGLIEQNHWVEKAHVASAFFRKAPVISALLERIPLFNLLRWLPSLCVHGQIEGENEQEVLKQKIVERLASIETLDKEKILPDEILLCWKMYEEEKGKIQKANKDVKRMKIPTKFAADTDVVENLEALYHESFEFAQPSNKRLMICTEIRKEFLDEIVTRVRPMKGLDVAATLMLRALKTEKEPVFTAFMGSQSDVCPLNLIKEHKLADVKNALKEAETCPRAKLEKVFAFAERKKHVVDVFIVVVRHKDSKTMKQFMSAWQRYKTKFNPDARVILVLPMQPVELEAPQGTNGMLTFVGYDRFTSELIWKAASGEL